MTDFSEFQPNRDWNNVERAYKLILPLALIGMLLGLISLLGYFSGIEQLYRPFPYQPATSPITALSSLLISIAILSYFNSSKVAYTRILTLLVTLLTILKVSSGLTNIEAFDVIAMLNSQPVFDSAAGKSNLMGINTAVMLGCYSLSVLLFTYKKMLASQIIAFFTLAIPALSLTGYSYGLSNFYGQMSIITTTAGFIIGLGILLLTSGTSPLRAVFSPYTAGYLARAQVVAAYLFPLLLGGLLVKTLIRYEADIVGLFVVALSWFVMLMVFISAHHHEEVDKARRENEQALIEAAMFDPLTGLANRRRFFEFGAHEFKKMERLGGEAWVLMCDLDDFKKVNDLAGHKTGDDVLVGAASFMKNSLRQSDIVSRIGGEEFAVLMTGVNRKGAIEVAEKIHKSIEAMQIPGWTEKYGPVTISIGCASSENCSTIEEALSKADKALYLSKSQGKNRINLLDRA